MKKVKILSISSALCLGTTLFAAVSCNKTEENVNATLAKAKDAFTLTPIAEKPITNVQASTINDAAKLKEYFTETPGADFGTDKGFTYTYKSSTANTVDSTQLDVVYEISYKGATVQWTKTIDGFENVNATLAKAKDAFKVTKKDSVDFTSDLASKITKENFLQYFDIKPGSGFEETKGFKYTLETVKQNETDNTKLDVVYKISYKGATVQWTKTIEVYLKTILKASAIDLSNDSTYKDKFATIDGNLGITKDQINTIIQSKKGSYFLI